MKHFWLDSFDKDYLINITMYIKYLYFFCSAVLFMLWSQGLVCYLDSQLTLVKVSFCLIAAAAAFNV